MIHLRTLYDNVRKILKNCFVILHSFKAQSWYRSQIPASGLAYALFACNNWNVVKVGESNYFVGWKRLCGFLCLSSPHSLQGGYWIDLPGIQKQVRNCAFGSSPVWISNGAYNEQAFTVFLWYCQTCEIKADYNDERISKIRDINHSWLRTSQPPFCTALHRIAPLLYKPYSVLSFKFSSIFHFHYQRFPLAAECCWMIFCGIRKLGLSCFQTDNLFIL